jgi:hypothetical protein
VAIEYSEVAASWPSAFEVRLGDVHDDGDPIFVIVLNESVEGINCVSFDCSVAAFDKFDRLYAGNGA